MRGGTANREQQAAHDAAELILFADGIEAAAGLTDMPADYDQDARVIVARKTRALAHETLWLIETLETERAARQQIQADRDRAYEILANQAAEAVDAEEDLPF